MGLKLCKTSEVPQQDCFLNSGTAPVAVHEEGRRYLKFEIFLAAKTSALHTELKTP